MVKIFVSFAFNGKEPFLQTITTEKIYRTEYTKSHKDHRSKKVGWGGARRVYRRKGCHGTSGAVRCILQENQPLINEEEKLSANGWRTIQRKNREWNAEHKRHHRRTDVRLHNASENFLQKNAAIFFFVQPVFSSYVQFHKMNIVFIKVA